MWWGLGLVLASPLIALVLGVDVGSFASLVSSDETTEAPLAAPAAAFDNFEAGLTGVEYAPSDGAFRVLVPAPPEAGPPPAEGGTIVMSPGAAGGDVNRQVGIVDTPLPAELGIAPGHGPEFVADDAQDMMDAVQGTRIGGGGAGTLPGRPRVLRHGVLVYGGWSDVGRVAASHRADAQSSGGVAGRRHRGTPVRVQATGRILRGHRSDGTT